MLINPFGEDDDDIELNWLIDRHIKASYMIVDEMHEEFPDLCKDQYWEEVVPKDLPYTVASEHYRRSEPKGSAEKYKIKAEDAVYANIMPKRSIHDPDAYADYVRRQLFFLFKSLTKISQFFPFLLIGKRRYSNG